MQVKGYMGSVALDGQTLTVQKRITGTTSVPVGNVQAVTISPAGVGMRAIRFAVAGGNVRGGQTALGSHRGHAQDPYALTFRKKHLSEFEAFAAEVNRAREAV